MAGLLNWVLDHQPLTLLVAIGTLVLTVLLYIVIPKGFFPVQDTGLVQGITQAGSDVSFAAMAEHQNALAAEILKDPDVVSLSSFIGVDGTNNTLNSGRLPDQPERPRTTARTTSRRSCDRLARRSVMRSRAFRSICSRCRT